MSGLKSVKGLEPKQAISLAGGVFAIVGGLRDLRRNAGAGRLTTVHTLLKITVAVVGLVVALKAADELAEDA
jgi:hypothetical protein